MTFIGPRREINRIERAWSDIRESLALDAGPLERTDLRHLGPEFDDNSPEVAVAFHEPHSPHVAHRLQAFLLTSFGVQQVLVESGYELRAVAASAGTFGSVRLDTGNWPSSTVLTTVPSVSGYKVATLDTGDAGASRDMIVFLGGKPQVRKAADDNGHGSAVGDIIRNRVSQADIHPLQVSNSLGRCRSYDVLSALIYALWSDNRFDVVNASLTTQLGSTCSASVGAGMDHVVALCASKPGPKPVVVAAAGNDPRKAIAYPALLSNAVVAFATDHNGLSTTYNSTVPMATPVAKADAFGGTAGTPVGAFVQPGQPDVPFYGTSFAAAFVTAAYL